MSSDFYFQNTKYHYSMEYVELEPKLNDFVLAAGLDWDYKCQSEIELLVLFKTRCCCSGKKKVLPNFSSRWWIAWPLNKTICCEIPAACDRRTVFTVLGISFFHDRAYSEEGTQRTQSGTNEDVMTQSQYAPCSYTSVLRGQCVRWSVRVIFCNKHEPASELTLLWHYFNLGVPRYTDMGNIHV